MTYPMPTQAELEAEQKAYEAQQKKKHDDSLESQPDGGKNTFDRSKLKTQFLNASIPELRAMILDADPDAIYTASQSWKQVHAILSGGDGDGATGGVDTVSSGDSVAGMLNKAVSDVMEHWQGEAAEAFQARASQLSTSLQNVAAHANLTATTLDRAQNDLRNSKAKMRDVKEPSLWSRATDKMNDNDRDPSQMNKDLANNDSAAAVEQANEKSLSKGKEEQLKAVAIMEPLAANYQQYSKLPPPPATEPPPPGFLGHDKQTFSPPGGQSTMPPPITVPLPMTAGPNGSRSTTLHWSAGNVSAVGGEPTVGSTASVPNGKDIPSGVGTNVDGLKSGEFGAGSSLPSTGSLGSSGGSGVGGGGFAANLGPMGAVGVGGGGSLGGLGLSGRAGLGGFEEERGSLGGAFGGGLGEGALGEGGTLGGARRGGLGAVEGGSEGMASREAAEAGSGLHGSRGGTQGGVTPGGMGGAGGRGKRSRKDRSDRPDYLVEDEETWVSEEQRRIVPPTIE